MLLVRNVFRAKYGMGSALVEHLVSILDIWSGGQNFRVLSDASGPFFTIIAESTYESMAAFEEDQKREYSLPEFGPWFEKMIPLVESGHREFWNIEHS